MNIKDLTVAQLKRALDIKEQIAALQNQLDSIEGGEGPSPASFKAPSPAKRKYHMTAAHKRKLVKALAKARAIRWGKIKGKAAAKADKPAKKRRMSKSGRAAIAAAAKARWAKYRGNGAEASDKPAKKRRKMSAAGRAKIAAAARARWAEAKAKGKNTL